MNKLPPKGVLTFLVLVVLATALYWVTRHEEPDPCVDGQMDVSGAVLADEEGDQDALVNRAIIRKGRCEGSEEDSK